MAAVRFSLLLVMVLSKTGCVLCTNDLVGPNSEGATFDPRLLGDWGTIEATTEFYYTHRLMINDRVLLSSPLRERHIEEEFIRFERKSPGSNTYLVRKFCVPRQKTDDEEHEVQKPLGEALEAHLSELGGRRFLSFRLAGNDGTAYMIYRIDQLNEELGVSLLAPSFFLQNSELLPHDVEGTGTQLMVTLTATTEQLREFLIKHGETAATWEASSTIGHRRAPIASSLRRSGQ